MTRLSSCVSGPVRTSFGRRARAFAISDVQGTGLALRCEGAVWCDGKGKIRVLLRDEITAAQYRGNGPISCENSRIRSHGPESFEWHASTPPPAWLLACSWKQRSAAPHLPASRIQQYAGKPLMLTPTQRDTPLCVSSCNGFMSPSVGVFRHFGINEAVAVTRQWDQKGWCSGGEVRICSLGY